MLVPHTWEGLIHSLVQTFIEEFLCAISTTPEDTEMTIIDCSQKTQKFNRLDDKKNENNLSMMCFTE